MDIFKNIEDIFNNFSGYMGFESVWSVVLMIIDISIVAFIVYKIIILVKETRAWQLIRGIVLIFIAAKATELIGLKTISSILNVTISLIALAFVVIFQPELRRGLEKLGRSRFINIFNWDEGNTRLKTIAMIEELVKSCSELAQTYTGAIIVVERETKLGDVMNTGVEIGSKLSAELLMNLFTPKTPLHDGAVIVRENTILAAASFLPLTENPYLSTELGSRHRAALGISEISDAIAIVVSEETGKISYALNGSLTRGLDSNKLRQTLSKDLLPEAKLSKKTILKKGKQDE
jgi:diadenylate cyclase